MATYTIKTLHTHTELHRNGSVLYEVVLSYEVELTYSVKGLFREVISATRDGVELGLEEFALYAIFGGVIETDLQIRRQESPPGQAQSLQ